MRCTWNICGNNLDGECTLTEEEYKRCKEKMIRRGRRSAFTRGYRSPENARTQKKSYTPPLVFLIIALGHFTLAIFTANATPRWAAFYGSMGSIALAISYISMSD